MPPRATSELLLVGSLPAESTESALRAAGELFCDLVFALPDGETGRRRAWVGYERERLCRPHPDLGRQRDGVADGDPAPRVRDARLPDPRGVDELRFERWPRIDDAIESYRTFVALRDEGAVPRGLRFQVGLPFPASALNAFKADHSRDYPAAPRAFEDLVARELERLTAEIPPGELAIQWDVCHEVLDLEGVLAWTAGDAWERFANPPRGAGSRRCRRSRARRTPAAATSPGP
jgi:hypothetical protein